MKQRGQNIAYADYVEVRFDKLYLNKPEPITMVNDDGEEYSKMPPIEEWGVKDFEDIDVEQAIADLKEGIMFCLLSLPPERCVKVVSLLELNKKGYKYSSRVLNQKSVLLTLNCL